MQGRSIESSYFIDDLNSCKESNTVLHYPDLNLLIDRRMELTPEYRNGIRDRDTGKNNRRKAAETAAQRTVREKQAISSKGKRNFRIHPGRTVRTVSLLFAILILSFLFGKIGVHADPKEVSFQEDSRSYKMITVEYGDTLWEIADCWHDSTDDDIRTYMKNVQEMNHLNSNQLQEGQLLLIYYGTSKGKETPNKASQL